MKDIYKYIDENVDEYIKLSWEKADNDGYPNPSQLYETVYYEKD